MEHEDKVNFNKTIIKVGNSLMFAIPAELLEYLELKEGSEIKLIGDVSKWGKFVAFFNPKQQQKRKK